MKIRLFGFVLMTWFASATIAGLLGWSGIWGSGSAFVDYLIPFPTTGGALHVPSIVGCVLLIAARRNGTEPFAGLARPLLVGVALAGALLLFEFPSLQVTGNPLGLFFLSDGLLAQVWLGSHAAGASRPTRWIAATLALLAPPLLAAMALVQMSPSTRDTLLPGMSRQGPERGDEIVTIYSSLGFDPEVLKAKLTEDGSLALPPEQHIDAEDQAVQFFDNLEDARALRLEKARATWCRYEDGTPSRWAWGSVDCFASHVSFSERLQRLRAATDPGLTPAERDLAALRQACLGLVLLPDAASTSIAAQRRCASLARVSQGE
jgi:hypothetical protein